MPQILIVISHYYLIGLVTCLIMYNFIEQNKQSNILITLQSSGIYSIILKAISLENNLEHYVITFLKLVLRSQIQ